MARWPAEKHAHCLMFIIHSCPCTHSVPSQELRICTTLAVSDSDIDYSLTKSHRVSDLHTLALPSRPPAEGGLRAGPELGPVHRRHGGDEDGGEDGHDARAGVHRAHSLF